MVIVFPSPCCPDVSGHKLDQECIRSLSNSIKNSSTLLKKLVMSSCTGLDPISIDLMRENFINTHSTPLQLDWSDASLDDLSVDAIDRVLSNCRCIQVLNLSGNKFGKKGVTSLMDGLARTQGKSVEVMVLNNMSGNIGGPNNDKVSEGDDG